MSRMKGMGQGGLIAIDGKWYGRWVKYAPSGKRKRPKIMLGKVSEMTQEEARRKLTLLVADQHAATKKISSASRILGGLGDLDLSRFDKLRKGHSLRIGKVAEIVVAADLLVAGYEVFVSLCPSAVCDMLAQKDGTTSRVEVKYLSAQTVKGSVMHRALHRNIGKFDMLAIVTPDWKIRYIDHDEVKTIFDERGTLCGKISTLTVD